MAIKIISDAVYRGRQNSMIVHFTLCYGLKQGLIQKPSFQLILILNVL